MRPRVLIVDDDVFVRDILSSMLKDTVFEVVGWAENGSEALVRYRELEPDLVLMDIVMPQMSGIEVTRELIALDPGARIVVCSALSQESLVMEALRAGARDFVLKPFRAEKVLEALRKVWEYSEMTATGDGRDTSRGD